MIITCHRRYLEERCLERGHVLSEAMGCVVSMSGDLWGIDVDHPSYPRGVKSQSFECVPDCTTPEFVCLPGYCCEENIFTGGNDCVICESSSSSFQYVPGEEEVVSAPFRSSGSVLTRNRYGSIVLNSDGVMFLDLDVSMDGVKEDSYDEIRRRLLDTGLTFRVYKTTAGFRAVCMSREFRADSAESLDIMSATGTDRKYVDYCVLQRCFRARLTPKHWRVGCRRPPNIHPRLTVEDQDVFRDWLVEYELKSGGYSVCRFIETLGDPGDVDGGVLMVVEQHDLLTGALSDLPLEPREYGLRCVAKNSVEGHGVLGDSGGLSWRPGYPLSSPNFFVWRDVGESCESIRCFRVSKAEGVLRDVTDRAILGGSGCSGDFLCDPVLECREFFVLDESSGPGERLVEILGGVVEVTS